jgi:hypothetical protein
MTKKFSLVIVLLISLYVVGVTVKTAPWKQKKIIDQDVTFYYGYLPATFIYHDWSFRFPDKPGFTGHVWSLGLPNGNRIQKMTMGVAFLYLPFFGMAHLYTFVTGGVGNGYSPNYHAALIWAGVFYLIMSLLIMRKILNSFFTEGVTSLVIITLALATNLFNYASWDGAMSHIYSFFLFACALWLFLKWMENPGYGVTFLLGLTSGLIVLIRPSNLVFVLFLGLVWLFHAGTVKEKGNFLLRLRYKWLLLAGGAFLIWIPQLIYWKINSGYWLVYSYLGEPFFFDRTQIINGLFSYRKGWLVYTPVMLFALAGIFLMKGKLKRWIIPVVVATLLNLYIVFSWWCWWYGGSFSARALVEFYVVLAFPLGAFYRWIFKRHMVVKISTLLLLGFFIWLNIFQSRQYRTSLLHWDSMSEKAYWGIWGRQSWPENYQDMLIPTDAEKARRGEKEYP